MDPTTGKIVWELSKAMLKSKRGRKWIATALVLSLLGMLASLSMPFAALSLITGAGTSQQYAALGVAVDQSQSMGCASQTTSLGTGAIATGTTSQQQVTNAKTIDQTIQKLGLPGRATLIALVTAVGESDLINIDYGDAVNGVRNPDGSLTTSFGLFQQQTSMGWGTKAQVMDPVYATESFIKGRGGNPGLLSVPNWQTGDISTVIHTVQRNADPGHYSKFVGRAVQIAKLAGINLDRASTTSAPSASASASAAPVLAQDGCGDAVLLAGGGGATTTDVSLTGPCPLGAASNGVDCNKAIAYMVHEMNTGSRDWRRWCLRLVSLAYGAVYANIPTAYQGGLLVQSRGLMHAPTKDYKSIPRGAVLWYDGRATGNTAGHVALSIGGGKAISNDVPIADGRVGIVDIAYFENTWGQRFMGWSAPQR